MALTDAHGLYKMVRRACKLTPQSSAATHPPPTHTHTHHSPEIVVMNGVDHACDTKCVGSPRIGRCAWAAPSSAMVAVTPESMSKTHAAEDWVAGKMTCARGGEGGVGGGRRKRWWVWEESLGARWRRSQQPLRVEKDALTPFMIASVVPLLWLSPTLSRNQLTAARETPRSCCAPGGEGDTASGRGPKNEAKSWISSSSRQSRTEEPPPPTAAAAMDVSGYCPRSP